MTLHENSEGRLPIAKQADDFVPSRPNSDGLLIDAGKAVVDQPSLPNSGAVQSASAEKVAGALPDPAIIDQLAELQARRKFYISVTNKQTNAAKAIVRRALGQKWSDDEKDREASSSRASRIVAAALNDKPQKADDQEIADALAFDLLTIGAGIDPFTKARHQIELEMKRAVRKLPVYPWAKDVHGFGELGLAVIVGESGDLAKYPKKGHLWKRLGLAPMDGKAMSTWRMQGGLSPDDWVEAGYSPKRRAEVYSVISEPLFRQQTVVSGPYRAIYDRRRAHTLETHPEWYENDRKAHGHMDALRVMTKYLIRDLWVAWRGRSATGESSDDVSLAETCGSI